MKFRIITDTYNGYELQFKKRWFGWRSVSDVRRGKLGVNSFASVEGAEKWAVRWLKTPPSVIKEWSVDE